MIKLVEPCAAAFKTTYDKALQVAAEAGFS
jgi:hypothetical protein